MIVDTHNNQPPTRHLTLLYIFALSSIALLAIVGQVVIWFQLQQQSTDALVINLAGRQRMLSQKLSKATLALEDTTDRFTQQKRLQEIQTAVNLWERSQQGLQNGDTTTGLPGHNIDEVKNLFALIEPNYESMLKAVKMVIETTQNTSSPSLLRNNIALSVQTILSQEGNFLTGMDRIVSQYQHEAENHVDALKQRELLVFALSLLTLLLEGLFVFRPAIQKLQATFRRAMRAEEIAELQSKIAAQKLLVDNDIEQILQTHIRVANGDLTARAVANRDRVLWQLASALNTLITRFQRSIHAEAELQKTQKDIKHVAEMLQSAKAGQQVQWPSPGETTLDPLIQELRQLV